MLDHNYTIHTHELHQPDRDTSLFMAILRDVVVIFDETEYTVDCPTDTFYGTTATSVMLQANETVRRYLDRTSTRLTIHKELAI